MVTIPNARFIGRTVRELRLELPGLAVESVDYYIKRCGEKHNGYVRISIDTPARPRTTGPRSQEARFRGHCDDIAQQIPEYSATEIAEAMKRMAVSEGYPTHLSLDGVETPDSTATLTVEQETILLRVQDRFADEHGLWVTEYDDTVKPPVAYRCVGGRTRKEMEAYEARLG